MTGWIIAAAYTTGWVVTARKISYALFNSRNDLVDFDPTDPLDNVLARAFAVLVAVAWPFIVLGALSTGRLPKTDKQIRAELAERDRRIRQLETQLGITSTTRGA